MDMSEFDAGEPDRVKRRYKKSDTRLAVEAGLIFDM